MEIDLKKLENFLREANKQTYANEIAPKAPSTRLKSVDYHFEKEDLAYHDTYFGPRDFIGSEIVYKENIPVWGMNYYGYILKSELPEKDVYDFLRQALIQRYTNVIPVRGPARYAINSWQYANATDGTLDRFSGTEIITLDGEEVYKCWYHGGLIR